MSVEFSDTEWIAYDVDADGLAAAADAIATMDEAAQAEWFPAYSFTTAGGRLVSADVTVRTRVTMPRWTTLSAAHPVEQIEWKRFCGALRAHEQGHIDLVVRHLSTVDRELVGKTTAAAQRSWEQALAQLESASRAYDHATDHGRKHGTIINASVSGV
jgi:predicted secreted Zn-dependent protease